MYLTSIRNFRWKAVSKAATAPESGPSRGKSSEVSLAGSAVPDIPKRNEAPEELDTLTLHGSRGPRRGSLSHSVPLGWLSPRPPCKTRSPQQRGFRRRCGCETQSCPFRGRLCRASAPMGLARVRVSARPRLRAGSENGNNSFRTMARRRLSSREEAKRGTRQPALERRGSCETFFLLPAAFRRPASQIPSI